MTFPGLGQPQEDNGTFQQSLQRAAFIVVAKVAAGVQKDEHERPLWRIVTVEKTLLDRTKNGGGLSQTWYAPMADLGTDDYCIVVGFEIEGTSAVNPPGASEKLSEDHLTLRKHSSKRAKVLHQVDWVKRVLHPTENMPNLKEALTQGFVLAEGKKVKVKDLVLLARARDSGPASQPN